MVNTSATGGYLAPQPGVAPLEGQPLLDFLQRWLSQISGVPGNMVRPRWQAEPPNIPNSGIVWLSFGIMRRPADQFPWIQHRADADGVDELSRHETMELLVSIYDTGSGGHADLTAEVLRDGMTVAQNLEPLLAQHMALLDVGDVQAVPALLNNRWQYRIDLPFRIRRTITRDYPVENVLEADGTTVTDPP
jgi:hypothetical protein